MYNKTIVIVSDLVDATIREYQPDVDFKLFKNLQELEFYTQENAIRAQSIFFTKEVLGGRNSSIEFFKDLCYTNSYLIVDRVIYITEENSQEISSMRFIIDNNSIDNWEIVEGPSLTRAFVTEVINGVFRDDKMSARRKAVYRKPRTDYIKQQLRNTDSLQEDYVDDEHDLSDIPDEEIPITEPPSRNKHLKKVYIAGLPGLERSTFTFLAAQYLSKTDKVLLIESDPEYHTITEFSTKSEIEACRVSITQIYEDINLALSIIREAKENLVIIECIDRIPFDYKFISSLLYYNLAEDFTYIISEISLDELPHNTPVTVTVPSTVLGTLATGELVDKSFVPFCRFVGINLKYLHERHINSGVVMSTILSDLLSTQELICPVVTITSLRLNGASYDLGAILSGGIL